VLIIVCGMYRSGSTLIYQIVANLIGYDKGLGLRWTRQDLERIQKTGDTGILKIHTPVPDMEQIVRDRRYIYSYRDIRDVFASMSVKRYRNSDGKLSPLLNVGRICGCIESDAYFRARSSLIVRYESEIESLNVLVERVASSLGIESYDRSIAERLSLQNVKQFTDSLPDKDYGRTLFCRHHVSDGKSKFRQFLSNAYIRIIEHYAGDWLLQNGYELTFPKDTVESICEQEKIVILREGDSLHSLFGNDWKRIYQSPANASFRQQFPDPNLIRPGFVLHL